MFAGQLEIVLLPLPLVRNSFHELSTELVLFSTRDNHFQLISLYHRQINHKSMLHSLLVAQIRHWSSLQYE